MDPRALKSEALLFAVAMLSTCPERERIFIDNLLVRNHFIIVMIRWTGLAPWGFDAPAHPG